MINRITSKLYLKDLKLFNYFTKDKKFFNNKNNQDKNQLKQTKNPSKNQRIKFGTIMNKGNHKNMKKQKNQQIIDTLNVKNNEAQKNKHKDLKQASNVADKVEIPNEEQFQQQQQQQQKKKIKIQEQEDLAQEDIQLRPYRKKYPQLFKTVKSINQYIKIKGQNEGNFDPNQLLQLNPQQLKEIQDKTLKENNDRIQYNLIYKNQQQLLNYLKQKKYIKILEYINDWCRQFKKKDVQQVVYGLLAKRQPKLFVQFFKNYNNIYRLPLYLAKQIIMNLIVHDKEYVLNFLYSFQKNKINFGFGLVRLLQNKKQNIHKSIFSQSQIRLDLRIAFQIFKFTSSTYQKENNRQNDKESYKNILLKSGITEGQIKNQYQFNQNDSSQVNIWICNIWKIIKNKFVVHDQFKKVFQYLLIRCNKQIQFSSLYKSDTFFQIISTIYMGSHVSSKKIYQLTQELVKDRSIVQIIYKFRQKLIYYKTKTNLKPFPNAYNFISYLKQSIQQQNIHKCALFYLLSYFNNQNPVNIFFNSKIQLINDMINFGYEQIINEGIFTLDQNKLQHICTTTEQKEQKIKKLDLVIKFNKINQYLISDRQNRYKNLSNAQIILNQKNKQQNNLNIDRKMQMQISKIYNTQFQNQRQERIKQKKQMFSLQQQDHEDEEQQNKYQNEQQNQQQNEQQNELQNEQQNQQQNESQNESQNQSQNQQQKPQLNELQNEQQNEQQNESQNEQQNQSQNQSQNQQQNQSQNQSQYELQNQSQNQSQNPQLNELQNEQIMETIQYQQYLLQRQVQRNNQYHSKAELEANPYRKQLFKILAQSNNQLQKIKAAIKLQQYQLAYCLFRKYFLNQKICQRMKKNIIHVSKAVVREEHKKQFNPQFYQNLSELDKLIVYMQTDQQQINIQQQNFLLQVWEKLQNYDLLEENNLPPIHNDKHDYWQGSLALNRAKQVVKMDVSGKLQNMVYEKEIDYKVNKKFKNHSWRQQLMSEVNIRKITFWKEKDFIPQWKKFHSQEQVDKFLRENQSLNYHEEKTQENSYQTQQQALQKTEQIPSQSVENVESAENIQNVQQAQVSPSLEAVEQNVQQISQDVSAENEKDAQLSYQQIQKQKKKLQQAQHVKNLQVSKIKNNNQQYLFRRIYNQLQSQNIKGINFQQFLKVSRQHFRKRFQLQYEQQKSFIKHMLQMQAVAQQAQITDNHSMQNRLLQSQSCIKSQSIKSILKVYDLWDFNLVAVQSAEEYTQLADEFRVNFFKFKRYMGRSIYYDHQRYTKRNLDNLQDLTFFRKITTDVVQQILIKRRHLFQEAQACEEIQPSHIVNQIISWGLLNNQPFAIYLGQKIANVTNQKIPHQLALIVASYLSHRKSIPAERIAKCKNALRIIGKINREHIYNFNYDYQHRNLRKHLRRHIENRLQQLDQSGLRHMLKFDPLIANRKQRRANLII